MFPIARPEPVPSVQAFLRWMRVERGVVESTLTSYGGYAGAYLGHRDARNSYWYLEATPVLLAQIAERCENFVNGGHR